MSKVKAYTDQDDQEIYVTTFEHRFVVKASVAEVTRFHGAAEAFRSLVPPAMLLQIHIQEPLANDSINEFTMWMGPIPIYWKAVHSNVELTGFTDTQTTGPMKSWVHHHVFERVSDQETAVVDRIEYEHHTGWRGLRSRLLWRTRATRRGLTKAKQSD
jgi:ligand-binding SRPBCC domain-containing protein